jgi:hypothetical protein
MGFVVDAAASPVQGYEFGFALSGLVAIAGGLVTMLAVDPEATRAALAALPDAPASARPGVTPASAP